MCGRPPCSPQPRISALLWALALSIPPYGPSTPQSGIESNGPADGKSTFHSESDFDAIDHLKVIGGKEISRPLSLVPLSVANFRVVDTLEPQVHHTRG